MLESVGPALLVALGLLIVAIGVLLIVDALASRLRR